MASRLSAAVALMLAGCATAPVGHTSPSDVDCGWLGGVDIRLRTGAASPGLTCNEAWERVGEAIYLAHYQVPEATAWAQEWTVLCTGGWAGLDVDEALRGRPTRGEFYPSEHLLVATGCRPHALAHELGHAADYLSGLPNRRDGL